MSKTQRTPCQEPRCRRVAIHDGRCAAHAKSFYIEALPEDFLALYQRAAALDGLDNEIALLRMLVREAALNHRDTPDFRQKVDLLMRAVGMNYRISGKAKADLTESVLSVLDGIEDVLTEGDR